MDKINYTIPPQKFELIRDRIGLILVNELSNQYMRYNADADVSAVWIERTVPFDATDLMAVNVSLATGDFTSKDNAGNVDSTYTYFIDCIGNAPTTPEQRGDNSAALKTHRLMGMCRAILEDPQYDNLGFARPFVSQSNYLGFEIGQNKSDTDSLNTVIGRLKFSIRVNETVNLINGVEIDSYVTSWHLDLTGKGYKYENGTPGPNPPLNPNFAYIVNQDDVVLALVPGGQKYTVTEIKNIIDTIFNNQTNITDDILP